MKINWDLSSEELQESVEVYQWLLSSLASNKTGRVFEFVYRSFYRIDNAGLTSVWKRKYFDILYSNKKSNSIDLKRICSELYEIPNNKGQKNIQFSFATKMQNILFPKEIIYDSHVEKQFGYSNLYYIKDFNKRLDQYLERYKEIKAAYLEMIPSQKEHIEKFKKRYKCKELNDLKVIDFAVWYSEKYQLGAQ